VSCGGFDWDKLVGVRQYMERSLRPMELLGMMGCHVMPDKSIKIDKAERYHDKLEAS
jgi:hypothetical protein